MKRRNISKRNKKYYCTERGYDTNNIHRRQGHSRLVTTTTSKQTRTTTTTTVLQLWMNFVMDLQPQSNIKHASTVKESQEIFFSNFFCFD